MSLDFLNNEIVEVEYTSQQILPIVLEGDSKLEHYSEVCTYLERNSLLEKQCGQVLYLIWGHYMQDLLDKMRNDPDWYNTSELYDPPTLLKIIERKILDQTEDQYCYATVYNQ